MNYSKEEQFEIVRKLNDKLQELKQKGTITFESIEEKLQIKYVYENIYPYVQLNLGCPNCVIHYLTMLQTWYEREYPAYLKSIQPSIDVQQSPESTQPIKHTVRRKKAKTGK